MTASRLDGAQRTKKASPRAPAKFLMRPNLMICNAAIYCTRVEPDIDMVSQRCTLVYLTVRFRGHLRQRCYPWPR
jgi:hypothetical protein